jgi:signal transduction histidine kinase
MKRIRNRIFIQILIPTICLFLFVVVGGLIYVNRSFESQVISQKSNELEKASRAIHNWLVARISNMIQLSRTPLIRTGDFEELLPFLREERKRLSFIYSNMFYILPDGQYWSTEGAGGTLVDPQFLSDFKKGSKLFFYDGPFLDHPHFSDSVLIAVPVFKDGELISALAATIPLPTFKRVISYFTMEEFEQFMLVNPHSIIIVHSDLDLIGKSERGEYGRIFTSNAMSGGSMVFVSVLRTTWKLVAFQPLKVMLKPVKQINRLIMVFFFGVVLLILFVSLALSSRITRPIQKLTQGVHRIMEGDYKQKILLDTKDELSELATAFNRLSEQLVQLRTDDRFVFLGHLSARVAHEVRKPLHIIQLAVEAIQKQKTLNGRYLQTILNEVENANIFIREILNFARPEPISLSRYSVISLLDKVARKYQLLAEQKGIELLFYHDDSIHLFYFDIIKMEEAFSNLMENAVESVEHTSGMRKITITVSQNDGYGVLVSITDTGPGFDEDVIDKILDPYFTTKDEGTGLGLSICYRIFNAHSATMTLENTSDHHAKVTVFFPVEG